MKMKTHEKRFSFFQKKFLLSIFLITAVFFIIYQLIFIYILEQNKTELRNNVEETASHSSKPLIGKDDFINIFNDKGLIRGIHLLDFQKYKPNERGKFTCFKSKEEIDFSMVNDDYCDCPEDGSDEPGTNACNNGRFYCNFQPRRSNSKPLFISSTRVNDGICDCCDGSDEWSNSPPIINPLSIELQEKLNVFQAPCTNVCLSRL